MMKPKKDDPVLGKVLAGEHEGEDLGFALDLLRTGRLLLQASSGGGKSETVRKIATLTIPYLPNLIVDPEGEYAALRSQLPFLLVGEGGEVPATLETVEAVVQLVLETGVSAIFDLFELGTHKFEYAARLFAALDEAPKHLRREMLITVDEAHVFAPKDLKVNRPSSLPFADLASRGRKRGYGIVVATQRLALLDNNVAALCENMLFGRTGLIDQPRTAEMLGYRGRAAEEFKQQLGRLDDGDFFAYGRAFGVLEPTVFHVDRVPGQTLTRAAKSKQRSAPPTPESLRNLLPKFAAVPQEVAKKTETEGTLRRDLKEAQKEIWALQRASRQAATAVPAKTAPVKAGPSPIDKEKLRMLAKKLEAMSAGLAEAAQAANEQEQRQARVAELLDQVRVLLKVPAATGKGLLKAQAAQLEAAAIVPELQAVPSAAAAPEIERRPVALKEASAAVPVEDGSLNKSERAVLNAIAWLEDQEMVATNERIGRLSGYSPASSSFRNARGSITTKGLVEYVGKAIQLTEAGKAATVREERLDAGGLQVYLVGYLSKAEGSLLWAAIHAWPEPLTNEQLGELTGYSPASSSFRNARGALNSLQFIDIQKGRITAAVCLFAGEK